jgi:hypothetical protein
MTQENLRELLARLHERLVRAESLDDETRELLGTLTRDIEHALGSTGKEGGSVATRLESMAVRLEAEHPALATVVRQLVDALGKAGI